MVIVPAAELGPGIVPVAVELGLARAEAELEHDPVAAALGLAQAVVEREHVPPAAVLARGHPHARLAVAPTTKSVTAAHRPDLVPLRVAEEGLAEVVAVTTREPAAAEAGIAWEVAE